jgi:polyphenol oxidase
MKNETSPMALISPLLSSHGFSHSFFTRCGGFSAAPFATLNFSASVGDCPEAVAGNLRLAAERLAVPQGRVYFLDQVHGTGWHWLDGKASHEDVSRWQGDITLSSNPALACGVRTADCVPVLLAAPRSGIVAAAHAGWRGAVAGVVMEAIAQLRSRGEDEELVAAVGPHIEACCFEVGSDVAATIAAASTLGERLVDRSRSKPHVDLRALVSEQLRQAGVGAVDHVRGCTYCNDGLFHSYRRDGPRSGRMLSAIVARCDEAEAGLRQADAS